jgi:DNA-binding response OmpR family regulator
VNTLVVDDDPHLPDVLTIGFRLQWPESRVILAKDGASALRAFGESHPNVVLLDVTLTVRDGFAVLEEIRRHSSVPIILLTARGEESGQVRGLEFSADEYVVKPFSLLVPRPCCDASSRIAPQTPTWSSWRANSPSTFGATK